MNNIEISLFTQNNNRKKNIWVLIGILCGYISLFSIYSLPIAFFPLLAQERQIGAMKIGLVVACFPVGGLTSSLAFGKRLAFIKRKVLFRILSLTIFISIITFGSIVLVKDEWALLGMASFCRLLQGISMGGIMSIFYSTIFTIYQSKIVKIICFCEISLAMSIGGFVNLGKVLYDCYGFSMPFLVIGSISLFGLFLSSLTISNKTLETQSFHSMDYKILFKNVNFGLILFCIFSTFTIKTFVLSTITQHMKSISQGESSYGIAFLLINTGFLFVNVFFALTYRFIFKVVKRRVMLQFGMALMFLSFAFYVPFPYIAISQNVNLILAFIFLIGFSSAIFYIPSLPELLNSATVLSDLDPLLINNSVSGMFSASMIGSEIVGSFIGGFLIETIGFSNTGMSFGILFLISLFLYLFFGKNIRFRKRQSKIVHILL